MIVIMIAGELAVRTPANVMVTLVVFVLILDFLAVTVWEGMDIVRAAMREHTIVAVVAPGLLNIMEFANAINSLSI